MFTGGVVVVAHALECVSVYLQFKKKRCAITAIKFKNPVYFLVKVLIPTIRKTNCFSYLTVQDRRCFFGMSTKSNWESIFYFRFIKTFFP